MVAVAVCSFGQRPYCHIVSAVELTSRSHYQELSCDSVWSDQLRWGQTWRSCRHCDVCFVAGVAVVGVSLFTASPSLVVPAGSPSRGGDVTVYVKNINQPSLPTLFFLLCSRVCFCVRGPFSCISFHKFSQQLSVFSLCSSGLISALLVFQLCIPLWKSPSFLI